MNVLLRILFSNFHTLASTMLLFSVSNFLYILFFLFFSEKINNALLSTSLPLFFPQFHPSELRHKASSSRKPTQLRLYAER